MRRLGSGALLWVFDMMTPASKITENNVATFRDIVFGGEFNEEPNVMNNQMQ
jgi:hypothetical protein